MRAVLMVVANILRDPAFQVAFVNCDDGGWSNTFLAERRRGGRKAERYENESTRHFASLAEPKKAGLAMPRRQHRPAVQITPSLRWSENEKVQKRISVTQRASFFFVRPDC